MSSWMTTVWSVELRLAMLFLHLVNLLITAQVIIPTWLINRSRAKPQECDSVAGRLNVYMCVVSYWTAFHRDELVV